MKRFRKAFRIGTLWAGYVAVGWLSGCGTNVPAVIVGPEPPRPLLLASTLDGVQVRPNAVTTAATGTFSGNVDPATKVLNYTITFAGLTPAAGSINRTTQPDGTGPMFIRFPVPISSPITGQTVALRQSQIDSLDAGQYYVHFPTLTNPGGEIRGNIRKR
jgi:hypothetical protein